MKKLILMTMLLTSTICYAQTKERELSNGEKFTSKVGVLMQKENTDIGTLKGCKMMVVHYTNLMDGSASSSLKFEYDVATSYSSDTKIGLLDPDEVDGLIKTITLLQEKVFPVVPVKYTEISFHSRGGFEAGCFSNNKKNTWETYLKIERFDGKSYVFLDKDDFVKLMELLVTAKAQL
jgi:hypothetical protein